MITRHLDQWDKHDRDAGVRSHRRANAIARFNDARPEWPATPNNNSLLFGLLEKWRVPVTLRNLEIAADELAEMDMLESPSNSAPQVVDAPPQTTGLIPTKNTVKLTYTAAATEENIEQHLQDLADRREWAGPVGADPRKSDYLMTDVQQTRQEHFETRGRNKRADESSFPARFGEARSIVARDFPDVPVGSPLFNQLVAKVITNSLE
jgi:hypothetical protein